MDDESQPLHPKEPTPPNPDKSASRIHLIDRKWLETNRGMIIEALAYEQERESQRYPYHDDYNPNTRKLSEMTLCWQLEFIPPPPGFEKIETREGDNRLHLYWFDKERNIICCPTAGQFIEPNTVLKPGDRLKQIEAALPGSIHWLDEDKSVSFFIASTQEIIQAAQTNPQVIGPLLKPFNLL